MHHSNGFLSRNREGILLTEPEDPKGKSDMSRPLPDPAHPYLLVGTKEITLTVAARLMRGRAAPLLALNEQPHPVLKALSRWHDAKVVVGHTLIAFNPIARHATFHHGPKQTPVSIPYSYLGLFTEHPDHVSVILPGTDYPPLNLDLHGDGDSLGRQLSAILGDLPPGGLRVLTCTPEQRNAVLPYLGLRYELIGEIAAKARYHLYIRRRPRTFGFREHPFLSDYLKA